MKAPGYMLVVTIMVLAVTSAAVVGAANARLTRLQAARSAWAQAAAESLAQGGVELVREAPRALERELRVGKVKGLLKVSLSGSTIVSCAQVRDRGVCVRAVVEDGVLRDWSEAPSTPGG